MNRITLDQANTIISAAFSHGRSIGAKPLSVVVVDPGGHVIAFQRQDGASSLRLKVATAKAAGALAVGVSSRKIAEMAVERPQFVGALANLADSGILPAAGGVIVVNQQAEPLGAVGITGDTSDNDEACALAGIAAAALTAQK